ncbi:PREDICTED: uncharacterized protein LOC109214462 isoform X1 [Nicotiana attenuata]|uniref:uncharacterized protein LOC109214462 isoform X1 n=1 Tax=Nicotiana attenuata TaxID=49451 RepID=UPI000905C089|nr:PREDICTED: uncharacterized protein LOC109214462 isoform X1 [Nicotiana attenuata]
MKKDCGWGNEVVVQIPAPEESITTHVEGFLSVYTYPFTFGPIDPIVIDFCKRYQVTLGQIHPSFWRIVIMLLHFSSKDGGLEFTLNHLTRLYRPQLFRGLIKLQRRSTKAFFASNDEYKDQGWMSRFVRVRTCDIIPEEKIPFPEKWNPDLVDLEDWVRKLVATSSYDERRWRDLARGKWEAKHHGIGDISEMRPVPPGEDTESPIPKSGKDNKRKRVSSPKTQSTSRMMKKKTRAKNQRW